MVSSARWPTSQPDPGVAELLRKGRDWWQQLQTGMIDIATIAREKKGQQLMDIAAGSAELPRARDHQSDPH